MPDIILMLIISFPFLIGIVCFFAWLIDSTRKQAKKQAKEILTVGKIDSLQKLDRTMAILSGQANDLEAKDLWQKLQVLKEKQGLI